MRWDTESKRATIDMDKAKIHWKQARSKKLTYRDVNDENHGTCTVKKELDHRYKVTREGRSSVNL